jgi:hypothetical protein
MKDLNVKQDSAYQWTPKKDSDDYYVHRSETHFTWPYEFAAYTAQDLLDMFPKEFHLKRTGNFWKFSFNFPGKNGCIDLSISDDSNFANVLASMLITLIMVAV